jgi:hypothetical protein
LRDLEGAYEVSHFLTRQYPQKSILPIAAGTPGWQNLLRPDTSLIIIGGFVTNRAFASYQSLLELRYSLRMGRLCGLERKLRGVKGQRVFHLQFKNVKGMDNPPRDNPQAIDDASSEFVSRDYGLVASHHAIIDGYKRRVISIAGVKGYGTLGTAKALTGKTDQPVGLNRILASPLKQDDSVEMIIATDVGDQRVDRTEIVEVVLNNRRIFHSKNQDWEPCELGRPCQGCHFGLPERHTS